MTAREHTNLLSIFAWVYAAIQSIFVCIYLLLILIYGGLGIAMALDAKGNDTAGLIMFGFIVLLFGFVAIMGIVCVIANIRLGKRLRSERPLTPRSMIVTAILNCVSWACGGILLMPFGIGLGVYTIWFSQWDAGKAFLDGRELQPNYAFPPDPVVYKINSGPGSWT